MVRQTPSKMQKGTPQILPNTSDQLLHCNTAILQLFTITTWRLPLHGHIWSIIPGIYNWHTFTCMRRMRAGTCLQHTHTESIELCVDACVCVYICTHTQIYVLYIRTFIPPKNTMDFAIFNIPGPKSKLLRPCCWDYSLQACRNDNSAIIGGQCNHNCWRWHI